MNLALAAVTLALVCLIVALVAAFAIQSGLASITGNVLP